MHVKGVCLGLTYEAGRNIGRRGCEMFWLMLMDAVQRVTLRLGCNNRDCKRACLCASTRKVKGEMVKGWEEEEFVVVMLGVKEWDE